MLTNTQSREQTDLEVVCDEVLIYMLAACQDHAWLSQSQIEDGVVRPLHVQSHCVGDAVVELLKSSCIEWDNEDAVERAGFLRLTSTGLARAATIAVAKTAPTK